MEVILLSNFERKLLMKPSSRGYNLGRIEIREIEFQVKSPVRPLKLRHIDDKANRKLWVNMLEYTVGNGY